MTDYDSSGSEARHTIRSVSLGTLLRLLRWPFVLLSMIFIPRIMPSETYGRYALFIQVYFMADIITDLGILQVFGRFVPGRATAETEERRRFLLQGFLVFGVMLAVLSCVPIVLISTLLTGESFPVAWLLPLCLILVLTRFEGVLFGFIYGTNRIALYSWREALRSLLLFAGVYVFYLRYGLLGAIWSLAIKEAVLCAIALYWTRHSLFHRVALSWQGLKPYVRFGFAFYVPMMLFGLLQRSGAIFVQAITQSPVHVGHFDLANQFFLMVVSFLGVILVTLLPSLSAYRENENHEIIHRWHGNIMSYCGVIVFLLFNALVWLGEPVIRLVLGEGYDPVRNLALIMILALIPGLIVYTGMNYAILEKDPKAYTFGVLASLIVMALTCLAVIPSLGAAGAAVAAVTGHSALALFFWLRYRRYFKVALKGYVKAVAIGVCFVPQIWLATDLSRGVVGFSLSTALFLTVAVAAGIVDLRMLRHYTRKTWQFVRNGCRADG